MELSYRKPLANASKISLNVPLPICSHAAIRNNSLKAEKITSVSRCNFSMNCIDSGIIFHNCFIYFIIIITVIMGLKIKFTIIELQN